MASARARRIWEDEPEDVMTTGGFDAWLDAQRVEQNVELVGGVIVAMAPVTIGHETIAANLAEALAPALRPRCRVFRSSIGVQNGDSPTHTYRPIPDILVHCGTRRTDRRYVTDPSVVVEVLSPTTMDEDRGPKIRFYKSVPLLQHIVLIYQDQLRIEHWFTDAGEWVLATLTRREETLGLRSLGVEVGVGTIYEGVID